MSGETKKSNRFRKNIKKNWKEITMANIIDDETIEYVGILAKLALSEEEKVKRRKEIYKQKGCFLPPISKKL